MKKNQKRLGVTAVVGAAAGFYLLSFLLWPLPDAAESGCRAATTPITEVQGRTDVTPLDGERVLVRGVVTGDFSGRNELGGFLFNRRERVSRGPARRPGDYSFMRQGWKSAGASVCCSMARLVNTMA